MCCTLGVSANQKLESQTKKFRKTFEKQCSSAYHHRQFVCDDIWCCMKY